ncbi:hypothetical protein H8E77_41155 [bacterium]|nr:hypothetical protein [bacterium]
MRQKELNELQFEREMRFIQIPGPNPILVTGDYSEWDGGVIETCYAFKDGDTYYLYYHGTPRDEEKWPRTGYRVGVATAPHPLGPWTKYEGNPIIDLGPEGSWEDGWVACASILKEEGDKYYLWYSGNAHVGLAYASSPLGPWDKYEGNPVLEDFGYLGSVVKVDGEYRMYNEYPISDSSPDQGPFTLAIAEKAEGPWEKYEGNPILPAGEWGAWDDGGFSEAGVMYHDGLYHIFYGGTKWQKLESIGYAYSLDGYNFIKHSGNPVAPRENNADASAFAEVYAIWEPPFYYVYHTLRYISRGGEDLGVQILATETPFRLAMPVLSIDSLAAGTSSELTACPPISLARISDLALTVECNYHANANERMTVHVRASCDGINYDTEDLYAFDVHLRPGQKVSRTLELDAKVMFIKIILENLDTSHDINDVKVTATLGSH